MSPSRDDDARLVHARWESLERERLPAVVSLRLLVREPGRPLTLRECIPPFLRWLLAVRGRSPLTARYYGESLRAFTLFCERAGLAEPAAVTEAEIETFVASFTARGCKPATAGRYLYALRSFWRYLMRERVVDRDVAATSYGSKVMRGLPTYLTLPEWRQLMTGLAGSRTTLGRRDHALIATLLYCGLRCAELATLRLEDLHLEAGWLRVVGKGRKTRDVPIPSTLARILTAYLAEVRPLLIRDPRPRLRHDLLKGDARRTGLTTPVAVEAGPYVFLHAGRQGRGVHYRREGRPLQTRTIYRLVTERTTAILGRRLSPHAMRHSYASRLRQAGGDPQLVQELLGHADLSTTMLYSHLNTDARLAEVEGLLGDGPRVLPGPGPTPHRADARLGPHAAIGARIRQIRQARCATQPGFARLVGSSDSTIKRAERGAFVPRLALLQRIAAVGHVTVDWILTGAGGAPVPSRPPMVAEPPEPFADLESEEAALMRRHMAEWGRKGGLKGGRARAKRLTAEARQAIATKGAHAKWARRRSRASATEPTPPSPSVPGGPA
jgi:site-specific recombinase XerD/transcriptional regulator with XRE-family HTH domain